MPVVIAVRYRLKPGKREELLSFVMDNVINTRKEPGNIAYSHYASLDDEQEMFVFEMWERLEDVDKHIETPHYVEFSKKRQPMLESYDSRSYDASLRRVRDKAPRWD
ncbi:MAG TPA: putative quinol monooxygenase [Alicycliphilus sp.]|nr:putative quinol monooxygenase [Alicycliphilus sp.]